MCCMLLAQLELNMWEGKCPDIGNYVFSDWHASRLPECTIFPLELKAKWANYANTKCFFRVSSSYPQEDHCKRHSVGLPWTCQATPHAQGQRKTSRHIKTCRTDHYHPLPILHDITKDRPRINSEPIPVIQLRKGTCLFMRLIILLSIMLLMMRVIHHDGCWCIVIASPPSDTGYSTSAPREDPLPADTGCGAPHMCHQPASCHNIEL